MSTEEREKGTDRREMEGRRAKDNYILLRREKLKKRKRYTDSILDFTQQILTQAYHEHCREVENVE